MYGGFLFSFGWGWHMAWQGKERKEGGWRVRKSIVLRLLCILVGWLGFSVDDGWPVMSYELFGAGYMGLGEGWMVVLLSMCSLLLFRPV